MLRLSSGGVSCVKNIYFLFSLGEHIGCPFATQEESGFEDELPAFSFLSFDPIMVAEQFTLMDAVRIFPVPFSTVTWWC